MFKRAALFTFLALLGLVAGGAVAGFYLIGRDLPQVHELESYRPLAASRLISEDGEVMGEFYVERRIPVPLSKLPKNLINAFIAAEDKSFFKHMGFDPKAVVRALVKDVLTGTLAQGGSTITQQLAKVFFLSSEKTLTRKLRELLLALNIERRYTKKEILTLYLNQIYLGSGAYGVEAAARRYFGRSASDLDLAQAALVAGLPKAPSRYSPLMNPDLSLKRRSFVLKRMLKEGFITRAEMESANAKPLNIVGQEQLVAAHLKEKVRLALEEELGQEMLYRGGLKVYTTLNLGWQKAAEKAVSEGIKRLEEEIKPAEGERLEAAALALDAFTGGVRVMVGGRSFAQSQFNRATDALRQPGSAFKPIVFARALDAGLTPRTLIWDAPVSFNLPSGRVWSPKNYSGGHEGEITLLRALSISDNVAAVKLTAELGPGSVIEEAKRLGIHSHLRPELALALGVSEVTLLELTNAFQVFAAGGVRATPFFIRKVVDRENRELLAKRPERVKVLSPQVAYQIVDMLKSVVQDGTGRRARSLGRPLAGKTGTTQNYNDALFVGFSPRVVLGVWVGFDSKRSLGKKMSGSRAALPIWIDIMDAILEHETPEDFPVPSGIRFVSLDPVTGEELPPDDPHARWVALAE